MFVACSTLCFSKEPLESALRHIAELEFDKIELAIVEDGPHLRPSEVAENPEAALHRLRQGPSLTPAALGLDFGDVRPDRPGPAAAVRGDVPAGQAADRRRPDDPGRPAGHPVRRRGQAAHDAWPATRCARAWSWPSRPTPRP